MVDEEGPDDKREEDFIGDLFDGPEPPLPSDDPEHWEAEGELEGFKAPLPTADKIEEEPDQPKEKSADDELDGKIEALSKPEEMTTIYLSRPLQRRTGPAVLTALQEMVLKLTRVKMPVLAIHSDRAREFGTAQLKTWLAEKQIHHTRTSGSEAAGNSTAELGVKWFKSRTRALLKASSADPADWPLAAAHASSILWRRAFAKSATLPSRHFAFGQKVWYRAKGYRGVMERKSDAKVNKDLPPRWKCGSYRGPAPDVSQGHLVLREDGALSVVKGLKERVIEPHAEELPLLPAFEVEEEDGLDPGTPTRRYRAKAAVRMMQVQEEGEEVPQFEEMEHSEVEELRLKAIREAMFEDTPTATYPSSLVKKAEVQYTKNIESILDELAQKNLALQVVHNVSLEDVKMNIHKWKASARKEYGNLKDAKEAFVVVKRQDLPHGCRVVPGKGVFTVKHDGGSFKRKTRFVACGNFIPADESLPDLFATGLDASSLRTLLAHTAARVRDGTWQAGLTDIRQAFVLAPWVGGPVAIQPPAIATALGLCAPDDLGLVRKSLYGLREAPAVWAQFRDSVLRDMSWKAMVDGCERPCSLRQLTAAEQIWRMVDVTDDTTLGYVLVYVDDVLLIGEPNVVGWFYQWLAEKWECDDLTLLSPETPLRFLGMEVHLTQDGHEVGQRGFVDELLRSHGHCGKLSTSQGSRDAWLLTTDEEEAIMAAANLPQVAESPQLREAQRRVGELLWLSSRTRPDIQYAVAILASRVSKAPDLVNELGTRLLDYLAQTRDYRLVFKGEGDSSILQIFTDSSFSPSSARSHGSVAVFYLGGPVVWRSARQTMVTLSTAESELIEGIEGALMGLSVRDLVSELSAHIPLMELRVDNQAAIAVRLVQCSFWELISVVPNTRQESLT